MARNIIVFVADGLRPGSVNAIDTPTLYSIRQNGVNFTDSHSLFPTFTTPNASAIATGHYLGDTGDFSNTIYTGYPVINSNGAVTPFIENDPILADINANSNLADPDIGFNKNNFLTEESLLTYARLNGYSTAAIGKLGPVAIFDVTQDTRTGGTTTPNITPKTVIIDDSTYINSIANATNPPVNSVGSQNAVPLSSAIATDLSNAGLIGQVVPGTTTVANQIANLRNNQPSGNLTTAGTANPNSQQQQFFADATTKAVLPQFAADIASNTSKGFAAVYWSRDPDGTQHNNGDAFNAADPGNNSLTIGINGPTAKKGVQDADANLKQIIDYLKATPDPETPGKTLYDNTDIFVTADHGFSTISKQAVGVTFDAAGTPTYINTKSYAASLTYAGVHPGFLPPGFVAIDLAKDLGSTLYDPNQPTAPVTTANINNIQYKAIDPTKGQLTASGNGVIGGNGTVVNGKIDSATQVVVAANGGSDLLYVPSNDPALVKQIVAFLAQKDYISGIFTDDKFGDVPGALKLSTIGLIGTAELPTPSIVINFKTFSTNPNNPNDPQAEVEVADTTLQQGQGMHGSFGRGDTFNNMAAIGPDFKSGYVDNAPVSNVDVVPTLTKILGWTLPSVGSLNGRVINEALVTGPNSVDTNAFTLTSAPVNSKSTVLNVQSIGNVNYFTAAGFAGGTDGLITTTPKVTAGTNTLQLDKGFGSLLFTRNAQTNNEIGVFIVDDASGNITSGGKTYKVGDEGYKQVALRRAEILFSALPDDNVLKVTSQSTQRRLSLPQGAILGFYSIANDTSGQVLSDLSAKRANSSTITFSFTSMATGNANDPVAQLTLGGGSILDIKAQSATDNVNNDANSLNLLVDTGATTNMVPTKFVVNSEAAYNDFVGYYKIADASGTVIDSTGKFFKVGDSGYAKAALSNVVQDLNSTSGAITNGNVRAEVSKNGNFTGGSLFAPFLIANGDLNSFLSKNSSNIGGGTDTLAYFAFANSNPDKVDHIRGIGANKIGFEDIFGGGDRDFNDVILQTSSLNTVRASI